MGLKKLRILQVVDTLDAGGMEGQLVSLLNRLPEQQFSFHVHCLRHGGFHASRLRPGIGLSEGNKPLGLRHEPLWQLHRLLRQPWDLCHSHNWAALLYAQGATLGGRRVPILHGEHAQCSAAELKPLRRWLRARLYRGCQAVHTVSHEQRHQWLAHGLGHRNLLTLQNGVDTQRFTPGDRVAARARLGLPQEAKIIGMVARFGEHKRHLEVIEAFHHIHQQLPEAHLLLVGDGGPRRAAVHAAAKASSQARQIHLVGLQSEMPAWYQAMDLLVVASLNEGLSNATLEAMSCGVVVLSHEVCGAHEALGKDEAGWVREMKLVDDIASQILKFFGNPRDWQTDMARAARQRAVSRFSWQAMAEAYAEAFTRFATNRP